MNAERAVNRAHRTMEYWIVALTIGYLSAHFGWWASNSFPVAGR